MKTLSTCFGTVVLALLISGCDRHKDDPHVANTTTATASNPAPMSPAVEPAVPPATDPVALIADQLRGLAYDARGTVPGTIANLDQQVDVQLAQWKSEGRQFSAAAEAQLGEARTGAKEKADACPLATPETWTTTRANAVAALEHLRGALHALETSRKDQ